MRATAVLIVVCLAAAGCTQPEDGSASTGRSEDPAQPQTFAVSADLGAIEGYVVDASIYPISGAVVTLREPDANGNALENATSDEHGRFGFSLLTPGSYRLTAHHPDFANATVLTLVHAETVADVRIILADVPSTEPYVFLNIQNGIIGCGVGAVIVRAVCLPTVTSQFLGPSRSAIFFPIPMGHQAAVAETDWANRQQVLSQWYMRDETQDSNYGGDWLGDNVGKAVLRKEFRPGVIASSFGPTQSTPKPWLDSNQNFTFLIMTYYDGSYQEEIHGSAPSVCKANPIIGYCSGIGLALQQKFTNYVSVFVHAAPDELSRYTAVPDR